MPARAVGAIVALVLTASACDRVALLAPTSSVITLSADNTLLPINGSTEIVAIVIESAGTAVQNGTLVVFTSTLGSIEPREARTHDGIVRVRFHAGTLSGQAIIRASSGPAQPPEDSEPLTIRIGAAGIGRVAVTANPATLPSTGGSSEITARPFDLNGNPMAGVPVSFTIEAESEGAGTIANPVVTTDASGAARTRLTTRATTVVEATVGGAAVGDDEVGVASGTVTVVVLSPATLSITFTPDIPVEDEPVTFTLTPGEGVILRNAVINFGDGSSASLGTISSVTTVAHVYRSDGSFTVTVTGTDQNREPFRTSTVVAVADAGAPVVTIAQPMGPLEVGTPVAFVATISQPVDVVIERFRWDFGDGTRVTTTSGTVSHVYSSTGRKVVTVAVETTTNGTGRGRIEIVIEEPEPEP